MTLQSRPQLTRQLRTENPVTEFHSVLVLNTKRKLYHLQVNKTTEAYDSMPVVFDEKHEAHRKVFSVAGEPIEPTSERNKTSASFAILPVKPEPNSSFADCYLINAARLNPVNAWTEAEWNDHPELRQQRVAAAGGPVTRVILATPSGELLDVRVEANHSSVVTVLPPKQNPEVWRMLRNGCVVGHAVVAGSDEPVPLINIASFAETAPAAAQPSAPQITGTLDFKWPPGKTLRVGLQGPPQTPVDEVARLLRLWFVGTNLKLELLSAAIQHNFENSSGKDYDILIDFAALPQTIPATQNRDAEVVPFPVSDLGSYSTRRAVGQPTMFAGRPPGLIDANDSTITTDAAYFASNAFKHILLHEFGHALGLPHLHQFPGWQVGGKSIWKDAEEVAALIEHYMGLTMSPEFLKEHFFLPWPGSQEFSEWPDAELAKLSPAQAAEQSVMMALPIQAILRQQPKTQLIYRDAPQELDMIWIRQLYPSAS